MNAEERLLKMINNTGLSIRKFAKKANLPYSTIRGMLDRGVKGASYTTLSKIVNALNINIEQLFEDNTVFTNKPNSIITIGKGGEKKEYSIPEQDFKLVQQIIDKLTNKE